MVKNAKTADCAECGEPVSALPTIAEFHGQEIHLFDPVVCPSCLLALCEAYSTPCGNCGEPIPPYSQVGVLKAGDGGKCLVHMNASCSTVGGAFHGFWGKGKLREFIEIEAC